MQHINGKDNYSFISGRQGQAVGSMEWNLCFISNIITDQNIFYRGGGTVFPLYIYPNTSLDKEYNQENQNLEINYEEARMILERFEETFSEFRKIYSKLEKPNETTIQYYKAQQRQHKKLLKDVEFYKE